MQKFEKFLNDIVDPNHKQRTIEVIEWVHKNFPELETRYAWNQPMFTDHDTFIVGFSVAKQHLAVAPELAGIIHFTNDIKKAGYEHSQQLIKFPWDKPIDFELLRRVIQFNIEDKANVSTFWRK